MPSLFHARAFEAVVDGGAVHPEISGKTPDGGALEVAVDQLLACGGGEAAISRWAVIPRDIVDAECDLGPER